MFSSHRGGPQREERMQSGDLIASLAAMASASLAKLAPSHSNLSALDRCTRFVCLPSLRSVWSLLRKKL